MSRSEGAGVAGWWCAREGREAPETLNVYFCLCVKQGDLGPNRCTFPPWNGAEDVRTGRNQNYRSLG